MDSDEQGETDKPSIEILASALAKLQNGHHLDSQDLWLGKTPDQLCRVMPGSDVEETATSLFDTIQQLKRVARLLNALSNSSKAFISALQEKSKPMIYQRGIMSLPDEILVQIYDHIKDQNDPIPPTYENDSSNKRNRFNKYNVCRRIRNLALSTPTLWTTLHSRMHREEIRMFLERSRNADLSIILRTPVPDTRSRNVFKDLLAHSSRWKELTVECILNIPSGWLWFNTEMAKLNETQEGTQEPDLPSLTSLAVHCEGARSYEPHTPEGVEDFFARWNMPKLRRLSLCSVIPSRSPPEDRTNLYKDLVTSFTFSFSNVDVSPEFLLSYVATLPNLREFTLEGVLPRNVTQAESEQQQRVSLHHLASLTLFGCDDITLRFILQSLDMPNVSKLALHMDASQYTTTHLAFLSILYDHSAFISQIKSFELSLDRSKSHLHPHGMLDTLLSNFRTLEHFSLSTNPVCPFPPTGKLLERLWMHTVRKWKLKTIRVSDCSDLSAALPRIMYYLARKSGGELDAGVLKPDSVASSSSTAMALAIETATATAASTTQKSEALEESRFERLEIVGRTNFVEEDFSFVPREKVVWARYDTVHTEPPDPVL